MPISRVTYIGVVDNLNATEQKVTGYSWEFMSWSPFITAYEKYLGYDNGLAIIYLTNAATNMQIVQVRACNACGYQEVGGATKMFYAVPTNPFYIFPNPASTTVTIQLEELNEEVTNNQILSWQGINKALSASVSEIQLWSASSLLRTYKTDQTTYQIPVSDLPKGIYFVRVIKDGKTYTQKLIKN